MAYDTAYDPDPSGSIRFERLGHLAAHAAFDGESRVGTIWQHITGFSWARITDAGWYGGEATSLTDAREKLLSARAQAQTQEAA